jgi:VWFA-related protein
MNGVERRKKKLSGGPMSRILFTACAAALALMLWAGAPLPAQQKPAGQAGGIRTEVNVVSVYFTVRDNKGRLIPDLKQDDFQVLEDGRVQTVQFFAHHPDVLLNIGVLLDTSTAMTPLLETEANAASAFFQTVMKPKDLGFAVSYASRVEVLQVPTEQVGLLQDKTAGIRRYGRYDKPPQAAPRIMVPRSGMPMPLPGDAGDVDRREAKLYDAVISSVDRFLAPEVGRKAMLILALADDAKSEHSLESALHSLKKSETIAYVVEVEHAPRAHEDDCDIRHIFHEGSNRLSRLAEETGGRVIKVKGFDKLQAAFEEIAVELHNQYSLGYTPINTNWDGLFRRLEIRARPKGYRVYARNGYYADNRPSNALVK